MEKLHAALLAEDKYNNSCSAPREVEDVVDSRRLPHRDRLRLEREREIMRASLPANKAAMKRVKDDMWTPVKAVINDADKVSRLMEEKFLSGFPVKGKRGLEYFSCNFFARDRVWRLEQLDYSILAKLPGGAEAPLFVQFHFSKHAQEKDRMWGMEDFTYESFGLVVTEQETWGETRGRLISLLCQPHPPSKTPPTSIVESQLRGAVVRITSPEVPQPLVMNSTKLGSLLNESRNQGQHQCNLMVDVFVKGVEKGVVIVDY